MNSIKILGIDIQTHNYASFMEAIASWVDTRSSLQHVCTVNPEFFVIAAQDPSFYRVLLRADVCLPDGIGIVLGARLLGKSFPMRVTGTDGVQYIATEAAKQGWRLFLLGAAPGIAAQAATILQKRNPGLRIVGTYAGSPADSEADDIIDMINKSQADLLFVAYGAPQQDFWIAKHRERLAVKMAMGVGGAYDYITGTVPRAPGWLRRLGLEWLYRLIRQPWRWRRMLRLPVFLWLILRYRSKPPLHLPLLENLGAPPSPGGASPHQ